MDTTNVVSLFARQLLQRAGDTRPLEVRVSQAAAKAGLQGIQRYQRARGVRTTGLGKTVMTRTSSGLYALKMTNPGAPFLERDTKPRTIPSAGPVLRGFPLQPGQRPRARSMKRNPYRKAIVPKVSSHPQKVPVVHPGTRGKNTFWGGLAASDLLIRAAVDREMTAPLRRLFGF